MLTVDEINLFPLLGELPEELQQKILSQLSPRCFEPGQTIIKPGDPARGLFFILQGEASVSVGGQNPSERSLDTLAAGSLFGEAAILTNSSHRLQVVARKPMRTALLSPEQSRQLLEEHPQTYRHLSQFLAAKLGRTEAVRQLLEQEQQDLLLTLSDHGHRPDSDRIPGSSRWAGMINLRLQELAPESSHVHIHGEGGTGKRRLARILHFRNQRPGRPLVQLDCNNPPPLPSSRAEGLNQTELLETAQEEALFGQTRGHAGQSGLRRGYLDLAAGGDLLLEHVEHLAPRIQGLLAHHLETLVAGERGWCRLLTTSMDDLAAQAESGQFSPRLFRLLTEEILESRPLRARKKDLPEIVADLLPPLNRKHQRQVTGLSSDAIHKLVDYSWPQNIEELRQVLDRAVALCDGAELTTEQLFLHQEDFSSKGRFNLLELPSVRKLVDHSDPYRLPGIFTAAALLVTLAGLTLGGPAVAELANMALWALWWPALLLLVAVGARTWCSSCPLTSISRLLARPGFRHLPSPNWLKQAAPWLGLVGTLAILLAEQFSGMRHTPGATALLLLTLLGSTLVIDLLFGHRAWCRLLCPLGRLVGQCARMSLLELHSNAEVCSSQCQSHECIRDSDCPMGLHPAAAGGSDDCVLCLSCARSCPHHSVRIDLRWPWLGILHPRRREMSAAFFAVCLTVAIPALSLAGTGTAPAELGAAAGLFTGGLLAFGLGCRPGHGWLQRAAAAGVTWLPLAGGALFCHESRHFLVAAEELPGRLLAFSGLNRWLSPGHLTPELGTLALLAPLILLAGLILGWHLLGQLRRDRVLEQRQVGTQRFLLALNTLAILALT